MARRRVSGRPSSERSYSRLARHGRNSIERMLDRGASCREIARELGRAPSTVAGEVARHRFPTAPRARHGEPPPGEGLAEACERLGSWPRCRDGRGRRRAYGCSRRPHVFHGARMAQRAADAEASESRRGIDETEESVATRLSVIRPDLARGLSPEQISAPGGEELGVSRPAACRWVDAGYGETADMEPGRKVGYRPRRRKRTGTPARHDPRRSHDAFLALGEERCAAARETGTVMGRDEDSACLLTLFHRPSRFQLALPHASCGCGEVLRAIGLAGEAVGGVGMALLFGSVPTDNGAEFADDGAIARALGEMPGQTLPCYCEPRRSDQSKRSI